MNRKSFIDCGRKYGIKLSDETTLTKIHDKSIIKMISNKIDQIELFLDQFSGLLHNWEKIIFVKKHI